MIWLKAVKMKLNDVAKREVLKEKTGFDVDAAIRNVQADRAVEATASANPARRTSAPNYKIVNK